MSDIVVIESTSLIEDIIAIEKEEISTVVVEASDTPTVVVVGNALNTNIVNEITTNTSTNITGILKGSGGNIAQAVAGTDYLVSTASGVQTFLTTPSSANLATMVTDETGSGALVFGTSPSFTTNISCPIIKPTADSTTALQITKADGITGVLVVDTTNLRIGINTNPTKTLDVYNAINGQVQSVTSQWVSSDAGNILAFYTSYADNPRFVFRRAGGTVSSPTAVASGNAIMQLTTRGYDGSASWDTQNCGQLLFAAEEAFTSTAHGTRFSIHTTPNGSVFPAERIRITNAGDVGINTTAPSSKLDVLGTARFGDHTTNYSLFGTDGTLTFIGTAHLPYGSFYGDNISEAVTISATDTYYEVGGGISGGTCSGFTFQNNKELKCLVAGKYKVDYSISLYTASANQEIETEIMINATAQSNTSNHTESITPNKPVSLSGTGILTLAVDDLVKVAVSNHTGTNNIIVEHINLTLLMVGG